MPAWIIAIIALVAIAATLAGVRIVAFRRARELPRLAGLEGADWMALCRVTAGGQFLDRGGAKRGSSTRGTLVAARGRLEYRPDDHAEGDAAHDWPLDDVVALAIVSRRDVSGLPFTLLDLKLPDGAARFSVYGETGTRPW